MKYLVESSKLLKLSVTLNLLFILFFAGKRIYYSAPHPVVTVDSLDIADQYNAGRNAVFQIIPIQQGDTVFVGNSLAEGFPVTELFQSLHVKNRGIGRNTTAHLINRLPLILAAKPGKALVEIGINDVIRQIPTDTIVAHYHRILDLFAASETVPYIQSLPYVSGFYRGFTDTVKSTNEKIRALCQQRDVAYLDLYSLTSDSTLYYDGLHLNGAGYTIWKKAIDSLMKRPADQLHLDRSKLAAMKPSSGQSLLAEQRIAAP